MEHQGFRRGSDARICLLGIGEEILGNSIAFGLGSIKLEASYGELLS